MAEQDNFSRPIQVFLDTGQFISLRESRQRGGNRDFFGGDNPGFSRHKSTMRQRIRDASAALRGDGQAAGFVIVQMREAALAKSYRPLNVLFSRTNSFPLVGGGGIGEIFFQCTPAALDRLDHRIESRAELEPRLVENEETGELEPRPSAYRSELGAIEDIRLPAAVDRIAFSAREAAEWLSRPDTLGAYLVELFRPDPTLDRAAVDSMVEGFRRRLVRLGGMVALPLFPAESRRSSRGHVAMSIQLTRDVDRSVISLPLGDPPSAHQGLPRDALRSAMQNVTVERHQHFLEQMAAEPLVRRISLPPSLEIPPLDRSQAARPAALPPPPRQGAPVVGIIDGGVADIAPLALWRTGGTDPIDPADRDLAHGTFIAGLVAGARALNPHIEARLEPGGCRYYDIPLMPRPSLVPSYYVVFSDFFDQLEEEVIRAKSDAGVRVFNLSLGAPGMRRGLGYSVFAQALDDISAVHDILFVVSAGNLPGPEARAPWPTDGDDAVRLLARGTAADELITAPAEHLLGLSVGALNPPALPATAPTFRPPTPAAAPASAARANPTCLTMAACRSAAEGEPGSPPSQPTAPWSTTTEPASPPPCSPRPSRPSTTGSREPYRARPSSLSRSTARTAAKPCSTLHCVMLRANSSVSAPRPRPMRASRTGPTRSHWSFPNPLPPAASSSLSSPGPDPL